MGHKCQPTDKQSSLDTQGYDSHNYDPCTFDPHPEAYCIKSTLDIKHIAPLTKCFKIITYFCVQGTLIMKVALDKGLIDALT